MKKLSNLLIKELAELPAEIENTAEITASIPADSEMSLIDHLKKAYCEEILCAYKYFTVKSFLTGKTNRKEVEDTFEENYKDELTDHAAKILERLNLFKIDYMPSLQEVVQNGSIEANLMPATDVISALNNLMIDETDAIEHYRKIIYIAKACEDFTTEQMAKDILADEELHYSNLMDHLNDIR